jgi:integrase
MPQDRKNLQRRGDIWYARVIVPPSLKDHLGTHLRKSLRTSSLTEANQRKYAVLAELKMQISRAQKGTSWKDWREAFRTASGPEEKELLELLVTDEAEAIESQKGHREALSFYRKATQTKPTLSELIKVFLQLREHSKDTLRKYQRALGELNDHFVECDLPPSVLDRANLLAFVDALMEGHLAPNTKRDRLGSLGSFWGWLEQRLQVPKGDNPFRGFSVKGGTVNDKRGLTPEEVSLVLESNFPNPWQRNAYILILLTGARPVEILALKNEDIDTEAKTIIIDASKTDAGIRTVPYRHPMLVEAIEKVRVADSDKQGERIFPMAGPDKAPAKNYINWFSRHRERIGLPNGTSLYSARKTFTSKCLDLNLDLINIERYIGHKNQRLALSTYSKGRSNEGLVKVAQGVADGWKIEG